jgi:hypothetical protein
MCSRMGCCFSIVDAAAVALVPVYKDTGPRQLQPLEEQPELLDLPLSAVSVMSSHNSYIRTLQHMSESTIEGIRIALECGCRCLELDVYRDGSEVFVAHGKEEKPRDIITTTRLPLRDALQYIARSAWVRTNDPLFLALELNVHSEAAASDAIGRELVAAFGNRLYTGSLDGSVSLRNLVGRIVLMCGGGMGGTLLPLLMNVSWNSVFQNIPSVARPETLDGNGTVIRVYPAGDFRGALSLNFDPIPFLQAGATFCALNVACDDIAMRAYEAWFATSSFVRKPTGSV